MPKEWSDPYTRWGRLRRWVTFAVDPDRPWMKLVFAAVVTIFAGVAGFVVTIDSAVNLVRERHITAEVANVLGLLTALIGLFGFAFEFRGRQRTEPDAVTQLRQVTKAAYTQALERSDASEDAS
jgi:hypothetical protein